MGGIESAGEIVVSRAEQVRALSVVHRKLYGEVLPVIGK